MINWDYSDYMDLKYGSFAKLVNQIKTARDMLETTFNVMCYAEAAKQHYGDDEFKRRVEAIKNNVFGDGIKDVMKGDGKES
jgi:hypothetical protein